MIAVFGFLYSSSSRRRRIHDVSRQQKDVVARTSLRNRTRRVELTTSYQQMQQATRLKRSWNEWSSENGDRWMSTTKSDIQTTRSLWPKVGRSPLNLLNYYDAVIHFLPRECATLCIARPMPSCGVRLSVCPSVTFVYCIKSSKQFQTVSPSGSTAILVCPYQTLWQYSDRNL